MLLNVYMKTKDVVATTESKILLIPDLEVNVDIVNSAKLLIDQLTNTRMEVEDKTVLQILDLPTGSIFNLKAKIMEVIKT